MEKFFCTALALVKLSLKRLCIIIDNIMFMFAWYYSKAFVKILCKKHIYHNCIQHHTWLIDNVSILCTLDNIFLIWVFSLLVKSLVCKSHIVRQQFSKHSFRNHFLKDFNGLHSRAVSDTFVCDLSTHQGIVFKSTNTNLNHNIKFNRDHEQLWDCKQHPL